MLAAVTDFEFVILSNITWSLLNFGHRLLHPHINKKWTQILLIIIIHVRLVIS